MFSQKQPRHLVNSLRSAFGFRLKRRRIASVDHDEVVDEDFVWDVPDPFAPLDPTQAHLHALIQAEIARMRRYESIGPLQSLYDRVWDDEDEDSDDEDKHGDDAFESDDEDGDSDDADADDEDDDSEDDDDDDSDDEDKHRDANVIVLHTVPRYAPSPLPPPPPPSPSSDTASTDDGHPLWHDLAQVYNDLAEAEERARKAKRDAHRLRLKALTV